MIRHRIQRSALWLAAAMLMLALPATAAPLNFTVTTSEPATVTGTPRIAIDVGGVTRYATYAAGTGTTALTFSYAVQPGDFAPNGIAVTSPLDLNGGAITDLAGNPVSSLTFSVTSGANLKIQTYTASFTTSPISNSNSNAVGFTILKAPAGASFTYSITSSGGAGSVSNGGTISGLSHSVTGVDVSALPVGTLTLSVTVSKSGVGSGTAKTDTAVFTYTGVLDSLPSAAAAYSVRRLRGAYAGPLLRVRRASDNGQQDIGSTTAGNLDTGTLLTFCAATSCFVTTWYDQSGNGRNVSQATTANQPRIVNSGSVEQEGSRPALRYTATGQTLDTASPIAQSVTGSANAMARSTDSSANRHVLGDRQVGTAGGRVIRAVAGGASYFGFNTGGASVTLSGSTLQQRVVTILSGSSSMSGALDGAVTAGTTGTYFLTSNAAFRIGGGGVGQSALGDWLGTISEATLFNSTLSTADRRTLERDQGSYFGISVQ